MLKTTEVYNQVMRTFIFQAFTFLDSLHSSKCEAVQPVYSLNLTSFILVHKLFQTLQLPTFVPGNLMMTNHQSMFYKTERFHQNLNQKEKRHSCVFKNIHYLSRCTSRICSICLFSCPKPKFLLPSFELLFVIEEKNCSSSNQSFSM